MEGGPRGTFTGSIRLLRTPSKMRNLELASQTGDHGLPPATGRIELADLRERVRKLEQIASGIDL